MLSSSDIQALLSELETTIAALDSSSSAETFLLVAASLNELTENSVSTVATGTDLPNLYDTSLPSGTVFFVESLKVPVFSIGTKWYGLDGRLYRDDTLVVIAMAWGYNNRGQLGDNTITSRRSPVTVVGDITNWSSVSAGYSYSLGLFIQE